MQIDKVFQQFVEILLNKGFKAGFFFAGDIDGFAEPVGVFDEMHLVRQDIIDHPSSANEHGLSALLSLFKDHIFHSRPETDLRL